jgi:hypothetical protein
VSAQRIPDDGEVVRITAPPAVQGEGGISYAELQQALNDASVGVATPSNESVSPADGRDKNQPRSFSIRVERSGMCSYWIIPYALSYIDRHQVRRGSILAWRIEKRCLETAG